MSEPTNEEILQTLEAAKEAVASRMGTDSEEQEEDPSSSEIENAIDEEIADAEQNLGNKRNLNRSMSAKASKLGQIQRRSNANGYTQPRQDDD